MLQIEKPPSRLTVTNEWNAFFKDDWKVRPSLTLNLGVRYEWYGVPWEGNGMTAAVAGGGFAAFGWSGRSWNDYWAFGPQKGGLTEVQFIGPKSPHPDQTLFKDDNNNFAPAVGFSWSVPWFGKDKTTVRGGYEQRFHRAQLRGGARYVKDPYLPSGGYLELRPDRAGWGVEMDEALLGTEEYVHWERKVPVKPDGATGYA